ncbi:hypothetical protein UlMin_039328 [Ulmus minor]
MELNLDSSFGFVPKSLSGFIAEASTIKDPSEKLSKIDDYVGRLEEEGRKIDAFKRELPLCMLLVNDAIERLREEAKKIRFEESKDGRAVEEFMPLKRNSDEVEDVNLGGDSSDKKSWMSSAQLWSSNVDYDSQKQNPVSEPKKRNEEDDRSVPENPIPSFLPLKDQTGSGILKTSSMKDDKEISQVPSLSLMPPMAAFEDSIKSNNPKGSHSFRSGSGSGSTFLTQQVKLPSKTQLQTQQQQQAFRKQRRCWSPELHRRFVDALQQLGGSQTATPKQIRELMQVEGLTNDEVKSHLQKYRLHVRKIPSCSAASALWMSQDHSGDHSKSNISQSGSPQGPLAGNGSTKDNSMEAEDDEKSDGHSWKGGSSSFRKVGEDV